MNLRLYPLEDSIPLSRLSELAAESATEESRKESWTFHDTFDWRLARAGLELRSRRHGDRIDLLLHTREGLRREVNADPEVGFVSSLEQGALRDALATTVGPRRLLPQVRVDCRSQPLNLVDDEGKTTVRAAVEEWKVRDVFPLSSQSATSKRKRVFRLESLRGYERHARRLAQRLESELDLVPYEDTEIDVALATIGRERRGALSKKTVLLDPRARTDEALKVLLRTLVPAILDNLEGLRRDLDPEFLHDFRVAVRRTRAALGQVRKVFAAKTTRRFQRGFRWLQGATGANRDLDVHLLWLEAYQASLPSARSTALAPVHEALRRAQRRAHRQTLAAIDSQRFQRLIDSWTSFLDEPVNPRTTVANASRPVAAVAAEKILRAHRRVLRRGQRLTAASDEALFHDLRIRCKKLRYLLELFRSLYPKSLDKEIKALKKLQDCLGDFNDCCVQRQTLTGIADELNATAPETADAQLGLGRLLAEVDKHQQQARQAFETRFAAFASDRHTAHLTRLVKEAIVPAGTVDAP